MSYESPVKLYMTDVQSQLIKQQEELILQAVRKVAVGVDHEELFRALRYDRDQYEKGYRDAKNDLPRCRDCASRVHDKASDEYWCDNPAGLGCRLKDDYFCPFWERRTE